MPGLRHPLGKALACLLTFAAPLRADPLVASPPLAPDVAALPRLADDTGRSGVINDALDAIDQSHQQLVTCYGGTSNDPYRSIDVLSDGPEFLSFFITLGGYCDGAAHPFALREAVTFDMTTGLQTDLVDLLPSAWARSGIIPSQLVDLYRANDQGTLTDDCIETLDYALADGGLYFDLGPDTQSQRLLLLPMGLPHVALSCEYEAWVPLDQLRAAGFHPRLLDALSGLR